MKHEKRARLHRGQRTSMVIGTVVGALLLGASTAWACSSIAAAPTYVVPDSVTLNGSSQLTTLKARTFAATPGLEAGDYALYFGNAALLTSDVCHHGRESDEDLLGNHVNVAAQGNTIPRTDRTFTFTSADVGTGEMCWARTPLSLNPAHFEIATSDVFTVLP